MKQPLLSILIPNVEERSREARLLMWKIAILLGQGKQKQTKGRRIERNLVCMCFTDEVEVIIYCDNKEITIGEKREFLYSVANGVYAWQIDDDDDISDNAIELILNTIKSNPNVGVITFEEYVNMNGVEYRSNHSAEYSGWEGDGSKELADGFHFHRTPYFKDVIRTELARSLPVPHERFGEDNMYADALLPLIKSEIHISHQVYRYIHNSTPHNERYGIK